MPALWTVSMLLAVLPVVVALTPNISTTTFTNPILPGFHPDPSCIHVPDDDGNSNSPGTFFCVSSSFSAFPGIPIHASRDLQNWPLVGHVLNRKSQLPALVETNRSTSGIWAPTLRYHGGTFYVTTTLVHDERPQTDTSRWDNLIFQADDPYDADSWTDPVHFNFTGYDPSPFWDDDGRSYIVASHAWQVEPGIQLAEIDLDTGEVSSNWTTIWTGTGGLAPEGPHIYRKDGYYYLLIAEGGTGVNHMVTMARSRALAGPYTANPANPVLTNANTTEYFQTVGHADLFQDAKGHWWAVSLATRSGPAYTNYPMGRETVLTTVVWPSSHQTYKNETVGWPQFSPVHGTMNGPLPPVDKEFNDDNDDATNEADDEGYSSELIGDDFNFTRWHTGKSLPPHFTYWRPPIKNSYQIVPMPDADHINSNTTWRGVANPASGKVNNTLRLLPSTLNLTGLDGNYAGLSGQTFVGRRQQHTLFNFQVDVTYQPITSREDEAGVSVFLTQNHHLDLGLVRLADTTPVTNGTSEYRSNYVYLRFRGITSGDAAVAHLPRDHSVMVPSSWHIAGTGSQFRNDASPLQVTLQIQAANATHYSFSAWPTRAPTEKLTVAWANNDAVSWGFTGALLGVYCTSNGGNASRAAPLYIHRWQYTPLGQVRG